MAWDETKYHLTADGSELVLDEGAVYGSYDSGVIDVLDDAAAGCLTNYYVTCILKVDDNPALAGRGKMKLWWKYSEDNATWTDYVIFRECEAYFRYCRFFFEVWGDPPSGQRPKLTELEVSFSPVDALPMMAPVEALQNDPPAVPGLGDSWIVGSAPTGTWVGHAGQIARCVNSTTPVYRYVMPRVGQVVFDRNAAYLRLYQDSTYGWTESDPRTLSTGHVTILPHSYDSAPAGTWTVWIDTAQLDNGGLTNSTGPSADHNKLIYKTCLKKGTYTVQIVSKDDTTCGIVKVYYGSIAAPNLLATFDMYAGAPANNVIHTDTGNAIPQAALYDLIVYVDGQNVLSGGYDVNISSITVWRTA